jgi:EpsG family
MTLYVSFFAVQILMLLGARIVGAKNNPTVLALCITLAVAFAAIRGNVGVDTSAYRSFYDEFTLDSGDVVFEPTFVIITALGQILGASSQFLLAAVAALQGITVFLLVRKVKESDLLYLILLANYYVYLNFNLIRVGLALYLLAWALLAVRQGRKRAGQTVFVLAVLTHFSVVLLAPAIWRRWYRLTPFAVLFVALAWETLGQKLFAYFLEGSLVMTNFSLGIGFIGVTILLALVMYWERVWSDHLLVTLFLGSTILKICGFAIPIFDRLAIVLSITLITLLHHHLRKAKSQAAIAVVALYGVYGSLSFVANSDAAIDELIAELPGMAILYADPRWVPYQFFWER